jgi:hypothetical protein
MLMQPQKTASQTAALGSGGSEVLKYYAKKYLGNLYKEYVMAVKRAPFNDICDILTGPLTIPSFQLLETVPCRFVRQKWFIFVDTPFAGERAYITMSPTFMRGWQWSQFGQVWLGSPQQAFRIVLRSKPSERWQVMLVENAGKFPDVEYMRCYVVLDNVPPYGPSGP